jgi:hypothetical protein
LDWYISRAGTSYGPFTAEEFARFQAQGQLTVTDQVWKAGSIAGYPCGQKTETAENTVSYPPPV